MRLQILIFIIAFISPLETNAFVVAGGETELSKKVNMWVKGDEIPEYLLEYKERSHMCCADSSIYTFSAINNYDLLIEILRHRSVNEEILDIATDRLLILVGIKQFFTDMNNLYEQDPELLIREVHNYIKQQSKYKHVTVDGIFISEYDMSIKDARPVTKAIKGELLSNKKWNDVLEKYQNKYEYSYYKKIEGKNIKLTPTRVGNYGSFTLSVNGVYADPGRIPPKINEEFIGPLLSANVNDILILEGYGKEGSLSQVNGKWVDDSTIRFIYLFKIREIYEGI